MMQQHKAISDRQSKARAGDRTLLYMAALIKGLKYPLFIILIYTRSIVYNIQLSALFVFC